jgi:hypothetical protein
MRGKMICIIVVCVASGATAAAAEVENCRSISDSKERLACFDKSGPAIKTAAPVAPSKTMTAEEARAQKIKKAIIMHLKDTLFDPDSIKDLQIGNPQRCITRKTAVFAAGINGFAVPVEYNAKNRYGGYVGKQKHIAVVGGDSVLFMFEENAFEVLPVCEGLGPW